MVFMVIVRRLPSVIRPFLSLESIFERVGARLGLASFNIIVSRRILENKPSDHTLGPVLAWDKNTATEK